MSQVHAIATPSAAPAAAKPAFNPASRNPASRPSASGHAVVGSEFRRVAFERVFADPAVANLAFQHLPPPGSLWPELAAFAAVQRPGTPLEPAVRQNFEASLGRDFSAVRIHTDVEASNSASLLGARAYTLGRHIAMRRESFAPNTAPGRKLLRHELTHVAQQAAFGDHQLAGASVLGADHPSERQASADTGAATPLAAPAVQCDRGPRIRDDSSADPWSTEDKDMLTREEIRVLLTIDRPTDVNPRIADLVIAELAWERQQNPFDFGHSFLVSHSDKISNWLAPFGFAGTQYQLEGARYVVDPTKTLSDFDAAIERWRRADAKTRTQQRRKANPFVGHYLVLPPPSQLEAHEAEVHSEQLEDGRVYEGPLWAVRKERSFAVGNVVQQQIEGIVNSGPASLAGRMIGTAFGGEKWGDFGAALGGFVDVGLLVKAGRTARARGSSENVPRQPQSGSSADFPRFVPETRAQKYVPETEAQKQENQPRSEPLRLTRTDPSAGPAPVQSVGAVTPEPPAAVGQPPLEATSGKKVPSPLPPTAITAPPAGLRVAGSGLDVAKISDQSTADVAKSLAISLRAVQNLPDANEHKLPVLNELKMLFKETRELEKKQGKTDISKELKDISRRDEELDDLVADAIVKNKSRRPQPAPPPQKVAPSPSSSGKQPPQLQRGQEYDKAHAFDYLYHQLHIRDPKGGDSFILDGYEPGKWIVSRKNQQLSEITFSEAREHMAEFSNKYAKGRLIDFSVPSSGLQTRGAPVAGGQKLIGTLQGQYILEVPVQSKPVPIEVLVAAKKAGVIIRDVAGKVYSLPSPTQP